MMRTVYDAAHGLEAQLVVDMLAGEGIEAIVTGAGLTSAVGTLPTMGLVQVRVAEEDAVMGVFCRRWGVPLIDGGTIRLPRVIGMGRALDLILTGRAVGAEEALAMGLVNRVVPRGQGRAAAEALAHELAALPQGALRGDRLSAYEQWDLELPAALANELGHGGRALAEGVAGAARFAGGAGRHGEKA